MWKHAIFAFVVAACGSKSDDAPKHERPEKTIDPGPPKVEEADLFPSALGLPTAAAKLRFGMTEADAKSAAPEIVNAQYGYEVPGTKVKYSSTKIAVQMSDGKVWNIRAELLASQDAAKAFLAKKWGEPRAIKNSIGTPEYHWTATAARLHAKLEQRATSSTVYFSAIMPRDELLGRDPKRFGFETSPLVGATKDDALKMLAAYHPLPRSDDPDSIQFSLPPKETRLDEAGSNLAVRIKNGKVTGYTFSFVAGDTKDIEAFAARLEAMYGKGKLDENKLYTDYPGGAKAELRNELGFAQVLWVGDYKK